MPVEPYPDEQEVPNVQSAGERQDLSSYSKTQTELQEQQERKNDYTDMMIKLEEQIEVIRKQNEAETTAMQKDIHEAKDSTRRR